jgi:hypothetical protein
LISGGNASARKNSLRKIGVFDNGKKGEAFANPDASQRPAILLDSQPCFRGSPFPKSCRNFPVRCGELADLMNNFRFNLATAIGLLFASIAFLPGWVSGQQIVLADNYDGTNFDSSSYNVGFDSGYTVSWGADFTVAGTGDYDMTEVILPLMANPAFGGIPNPANYRISVVTDVGGRPIGDLVGSVTPGNLGPSGANLTYEITGVLQGGIDYWLLFEPIAPDNGCIEWNFSAPWQSGGIGHVAERWSSSGVPTGDWTISGPVGAIQPAFVIEGIEVVPEPGCQVLLGLGLTMLMIRGCLYRIAVKKD